MKKVSAKFGRGRARKRQKRATFRGEACGRRVEWEEGEKLNDGCGLEGGSKRVAAGVMRFKSDELRWYRTSLHSTHVALVPVESCWLVGEEP